MGFNHLEHLSDRELWERHVGGDNEAFDVLRERHEADLFRYLVLSLGDVRGAAAQLGRVLCMADAYREPLVGFKSVRGWLFAVATQNATPAHRREDYGLSDLIDDFKRPGPDDRDERMRHALADMRREVRQPLLLGLVGGLSVSEIAAACRFTQERTVRRIETAYRRLAATGLFEREPPK